jgi:hypothetical protein
MGDIDEQVDPQQWNEFVRKSQDSLRVIAEETGGIAIVNQNDMSKALKRIDAETSDYYVLGYYSKNPDPTKRRRQIDVKVTRKGANVWFRKEHAKLPPRRRHRARSSRPETVEPEQPSEPDRAPCRLSAASPSAFSRRASARTLPPGRPRRFRRR